MPYWSPVDDPIVAAAVRASEAVVGKGSAGLGAAIAPSMAGTAPMWAVCGRDAVPTVSLGAGRDDSMAHAPDENYRVSDAVDAARITARFLDEFAVSRTGA